MNNYVEIVTDENGESHFKDVTLVFDAVDIAPPAAPMNVSPFIPAKDVAVIHLPSGSDRSACFVFIFRRCVIHYWVRVFDRRWLDGSLIDEVDVNRYCHAEWTIKV